jgi:hypothetical protein
MSIGDSGKALIHFRRAVAQGPGFLENRVGLVEALISEEAYSEACGELGILLTGLPPVQNSEDVWQRLSASLKQLCSRLVPE